MYVYFARANDLIKIGRARNVERRMAALRSQMPYDLTLLGVIPETAIPEGQIHELFSAHRARGEWFRPAPDLLAFIDRHAMSAQPREDAWLPPLGSRVRTPGEIGNLVRGHRVAAGLTQAALAQRVGCGRQWISKLERSAHRAPLGLVLNTLMALDIPLGIVERKPEEPSLIDQVIEAHQGR